MPELTRQQMEAVINRGASVMLNSGSTAVVATTIAELPSEAALARRSGDKAKVDDTRSMLLERKAAIERELAMVDAPVAPAEVDTPGQPVSPLEFAAQAKAQERMAAELQREQAVLEARAKAIADQKASLDQADADLAAQAQQAKTQAYIKAKAAAEAQAKAAAQAALAPAKGAK